MNAPSIDTTATTSEPEGTFDQRLAAVHDEIRHEALSAPEPAVEGESAPADGQGSPQPPAPSAADSDAAKRAQERRERLEALKAQEREKVSRKDRDAKVEAERETLRRQLAEVQARAEKLVDVEQLDELGLLGLAQRKGIGPDKLAEAINLAMTNPEHVAQRTAAQAAKGIVDPVVSALTAKLATLEERLAKYDEQAKLAEQNAEAQRQAQAFAGMVQSAAATAPLSARLLETDPEEFWQLADLAASRAPVNGPEALLDALEEMLDSDTRAVAQKYATLYGFTSPSNAPAATTPPRSAAAKATTVSNAHAQQRASVVEEDDWSDLSFDERVARIKASGR